jgi:MFS transporter, DHA1 family, tetracycline resistance protein
VVGPGLFTITFAHFIGSQTELKLPGAPFLLAGVMLVIAFAFAFRVKGEYEQPNPPSQ